MGIDELVNKIKELYDLYENDKFLIDKMENYILNDLSNLLINAKNNKLIKFERHQLLIEGQQEFIDKFINKNIYYYNSTSEIFFKYDNINYTLTKQDDIIYTILSELNYKTNNYNNEYYKQQLLPWKFKIKTSIIKKIKEFSIFSSIPESITIQNVIKIFNENFFNNKNESKYFLIILGDIILKKNSNNIFIIHNTSKQLLRILENLGSYIFSYYSLLNSFKFKFHEYNFENCRLLNFNYNKNQELNKNLYELLEKNIINIIVVSCYLSNRYNNSDEYLINCNDYNFKEHCLYLKNNNIDIIIDNFITTKLKHDENSIINLKNMIFIWKTYIEELNIPNVIFNNNLKNYLKIKLNYDENSDQFINYTSNNLPFVSKFIKFWEENISENNDEYFLELEEICILFKKWLSTSKYNKYIEINNIIKLIGHYFCDVNIENSKLIIGYSCKLFDKNDKLKEFFNNNLIHKNNNYNLYKSYINNNRDIIIISKSYFDLYYEEYIKLL